MKKRIIFLSILILISLLLTSCLSKPKVTKNENENDSTLIINDFEISKENGEYTVKNIGDVKYDGVEIILENNQFSSAEKENNYIFYQNKNEIMVTSINSNTNKKIVKNEIFIKFSTEKSLKEGNLSIKGIALEQEEKTKNISMPIFSLSNKIINLGEEFVVPFYVKNLKDFDGFSITFNYDASIIEFLDYELNNVLMSLSKQPLEAIYTGKINVGYIFDKDVTNFNEENPLINFRFKSKGIKEDTLLEFIESDSFLTLNGNYYDIGNFYNSSVKIGTKDVLGDFNNDGKIDLRDITDFIENGLNSPYNSFYDIYPSKISDGSTIFDTLLKLDEKVDIYDFIVMAKNYGQGNTPPIKVSSDSIELSLMPNSTETFDLNSVFEDNEQDNLFFKIIEKENIQGNLSLENGVISYTSPSVLKETTTYSFDLWYSDGYYENIETLNIKVIGRNLPPTIVKNIENQELTVGSSLEFYLNNHFEDPEGDPLNYSLSDTSPGFLNSNIFTFNASAQGTESVEIIASDPEGNKSTILFDITVKELLIPTIKMIYNEEIIVNNEHKINISTKNLQDISNLKIKLVYDSTFLQYKEVSSMNGSVIINKLNVGNTLYIELNTDGIINPNSLQDIISVTFNPIKEGTTSISFYEIVNDKQLSFDYTEVYSLTINPDNTINHKISLTLPNSIETSINQDIVLPIKIEAIDYYQNLYGIKLYINIDETFFDNMNYELKNQLYGLYSNSYYDSINKQFIIEIVSYKELIINEISEILQLNLNTIKTGTTNIFIEKLELIKLENGILNKITDFEINSTTTTININ
jgi:hypothetical protein